VIEFIFGLVIDSVIIGFFWWCFKQELERVAEKAADEIDHKTGNVDDAKHGTVTAWEALQRSELLRRTMQSIFDTTLTTITAQRDNAVLMQSRALQDKTALLAENAKLKDEITKLWSELHPEQSASA